MTIDWKRLLELALVRLESERARVNQEVKAIQAELKGGRSRAGRMPPVDRRGAIVGATRPLRTR
jgi:hypothetical protein